MATTKICVAITLGLQVSCGGLEIPSGKSDYVPTGPLEDRKGVLLEPSAQSIQCARRHLHHLDGDKDVVSEHRVQQLMELGFMLQMDCSFKKPELLWMIRNRGL